MGIRCPTGTNTTGFIRHVYDDISEEEIKSEINEMFSESSCELFKRKTDSKFTGSIKVEFKSRDDLL